MFLKYSTIASYLAIIRARLFVFISIILLLVHASGAANTPKPQDSQESCVAALTKADPTTSLLSREKIKEFFDLLRLRGVNLELQYEIVDPHNDSHPPHSTTEQGYDYFKNRLGFRAEDHYLVTSDAEEALFVMLNDLFKSYGDIETIEKEGLWPSLTFYNGYEYKFIRLGLDVEALERLSLDFKPFDTGEQLEYEAYNLAIMRGHLPTASRFFHMI